MPSLRTAYCNQTYSPPALILSESVCSADYYEFEFDGPTLSMLTAGNYAAQLNNATPSLQPGLYQVRVRASQGGVLGDWGSPCNITISGPSVQQEGAMALRNVQLAGTSGTAKLYPNPGYGEQVMLELAGLPSGENEISVQVHDVYGQQLSQQTINGRETSISAPLRFNDRLAGGVYLVHILVNGEVFAVERMVVN
jgi:hypothetical protein